MEILSTGDLARKTGVSLRTIRFYAEAGLLAPIQISGEGKRPKYAVSAIEQVEKIQLLAETGMKLSEIHELINSIEFIPTKKKARTLYLRKRIEDQRYMIAEKEKWLHEARLRLEGVLEQTLRCPACPSRGENQDCGPCRNLGVLEAAALGYTYTSEGLAGKAEGDTQK